MFPKGTIYESQKSSEHGVIFLKAPFKVRFFYGLARGIGSGLIGFAVLVMLFTMSPIVKEELKYAFKKEDKIEVGFSDLIEKTKAQEAQKVQEEAEALGIDSYFSIYIPKIDAKAKIIANVDSADQKDYLSALEKGVAHAKGTHFPGQGENIYLFSHSTDTPFNAVRLNAVFYLLRKLEPGDRVVIYFADKKYEYQVEGKVVTKPDDTSWLTENTASERLVLQSCDPPGTTWNRLIVTAKPI